MLELPEVETIRRQLGRDCAARPRRIELLRTDAGPRGRRFVAALEGRIIKRVERRAKLLIWRFAGGGALAAHLKMTGRLVFVGGDYEPGKHDRAIFYFRGTQRLIWSDVRQFGFLRIVKDAELDRLLSAYGPEPLETSVGELASRLERPKTRTVKAALLDQAAIAGVGNIYADEALHRAGIRPTRRLGRLTQADRLRLAREIQNVLRESIAMRGTSASDYVDAKGERGGFLASVQASRVKRVVWSAEHYCPDVRI